MTHPVRSATVQDLETLRDLYRRASLTNEGDRAVLLTHPEALLWQPDGTIPSGTRVCVDLSDVALGFATVVEVDGVLELDDLFTDPDVMRQGVATTLVADAAATAHATGHPSIEVTANPHAAQFYASVGFIWVGDIATEFGSGSRLRLEV